MCCSEGLECASLNRLCFSAAHWLLKAGDQHTLALHQAKAPQLALMDQKPTSELDGIFQTFLSTLHTACFIFGC